MSLGEALAGSTLRGVLTLIKPFTILVILRIFLGAASGDLSSLTSRSGSSEASFSAIEGDGHYPRHR